MGAVRRVAIVGGGIAGFSTALALRQRGIEATVYEQAPELREVGAGIALWPNATRALRQLGVLDAVAMRSGPAETVWIVRTDGRPLIRFSTARPDAPALCIHRADLVGVLADALAPAAIQFGDAVERVTREAGAVGLQLASGRSVEIDLVVAADGIWSRVRDSCVEAVRPRYQGYTAWRAVTRMPSVRPACDAFEAWGDGRRFGLFALAGGRAYWYALASRREGERHRSPVAEKNDVLEMVDSWHPSMREAVDSTPVEAIVRHDIYDRAPARRWYAGRVVLAGDAAHGMTPDVGQGGAQALEDAVALGEALGTARSLADGLARYDLTRARRAARVATLSRWSARLGQLSGRGGRARNALATVVPSRWFELGFTAPF